MHILGGHPNEVPSILSGKHVLKYAGSNNLDLDAMSAVAKSARKRSLEEFEETVMLMPRCDISLRRRYPQDNCVMDTYVSNHTCFTITKNIAEAPNIAIISALYLGRTKSLFSHEYDSFLTGEEVR